MRSRRKLRSKREREEQRSKSTPRSGGYQFGTSTLEDSINALYHCLCEEQREIEKHLAQHTTG